MSTPRTPVRAFAALVLLLAARTLGAEPTWPELGTPLPAQGGGEKDAAVIVGVEKYLAVPGIPGAVLNAQDWYSYLSRTRLVPPTNIALLRDSLATREKIKKALGEAAQQVKPGGTLWFVFIGHGAPARDAKDGVLVGFDAQQDADSLYDRSLARSEVLALAAGGAPHRSLLLLDACFSGRSSGGELVKGLQPLIPLAARVGDLGATVLFTAGSSDQFAGPLPGGSRPAFTYLLLGGLRGWADRNADGLIALAELQQYVRDSLQTVLTDRSQTPELSGTLFPEPLARGTETGPDLTAWVLANRPRATGGSELSFGGAVAINVPRVTVTSAAGLRELNMQAEQLLERAQDTEDQKAATPDVKSEAWCRLAGITLNNPYASQASEGCKAWRAYGAAVRRRDASVAEDYQTLAGYLRLRRKPKEQKLATATAFLSAYSGLTGDPQVNAVANARAALQAGQDFELPDQEPALRSACEGGAPLPCVILGNFSARGVWPLQREDAQAAALFARACTPSSSLGCTALGNLHERGVGVPQSYPTAAAFYQKACDGNDGAGCAALAGMWFTGRGFERNAQRAASFLDRACDTGEATSCLHLGALYGRGGDVQLPANPSKALELYEKACNGGEAQGCEAAATAYRDGTGAAADATRALALYERSCASGRAPACAAEALMFDQKDDDRSALLYRKACELGEARSCTQVQNVAQRREAQAAQAKLQLTRVAERQAKEEDQSRLRGYLVVGGGAACLVAAGLLAASGASLNADLVAGKFDSGADMTQAVGTGKLLNGAGYAFAGLGAVGVLAGVFLVLNAPAGPVTVTAAPTPGGASMAVGGSF